MGKEREERDTVQAPVTSSFFSSTFLLSTKRSYGAKVAGRFVDGPGDSVEQMFVVMSE